MVDDIEVRHPVWRLSEDKRWLLLIDLESEEVLFEVHAVGRDAELRLVPRRAGLAIRRQSP